MLQNNDLNRPPHETPVGIDVARMLWPEAYEIALNALRVDPVHATTAVMDSRLVLFLWGPTFDMYGDDTEMAGIAAVTGPLSDEELHTMQLARDEVQH